MNISWTNPKIIRGDTQGYGHGVFAEQDITKGEIVAVFGGYVVAMSDLPKIRESSPDEYDIILRTGYQISENLIFSPVSEAQFSVIEYLNHSCDPNCGFKSKIELVAMRDIQKDEEVVMDYAMCITSEPFSHKCLCGSSYCRKMVSGDDWTNPVLQKRYKGYFQPYINAKIR